MTKWPLSQGCKDSLLFTSINVMHHVNKLKDKNHVYLNRFREGLWQNSTSLYDNNPPERRNRMNRLQYNKSYIWHNHNKMTLSGEKLKGCPIQWRRRKQFPLSPLCHNIVLEILTIVIREEKETKGIHIVKEELKVSVFADIIILYIENRKDSTRKITRANQWI